MIRKRTQIYRRFFEADFVFGDNNGYSVPLSINKQRTQDERKSGLALCDLSAMSRVGYRGADVESWCESQYGITCPRINRSALTKEGLLIVRLSSTEILVLEDPKAKPDLEVILDNVPAAYILPRQDSHHCFMLLGQHCASMFSKMCAVDLRYHKFQEMHVAQTIMARVSVIIVRRDMGETPAYYVLVDSSLAEYMWDSMLDAMQEFEGKVIGSNDLTVGELTVAGEQ